MNAEHVRSKNRNILYYLVLASLVILARVVTKCDNFLVGGPGVHLHVALRFLILPRGIRICESHFFGFKSHLFGFKSHLFAFFCI